MPYYERYKKYQKYKNGKPVIPYEYKEGEFIGLVYKTNIFDCENIQINYRRWVPNGDFICQGYDKYEVLIEQGSEDGVTWFNIVPEVTKTGNLIEEYSDFCSTITWQIVKDKYVCLPSEDSSLYNIHFVLQKYKNGEPAVPEEFKTGSVHTHNKFYFTLEECEQGITWEYVNTLTECKSE